MLINPLDDGRNFFSPHDLVTFAESEFASWLERAKMQGLLSEPSFLERCVIPPEENEKKKDATASMLKKHGDIWEKRVLAELRKRHGKALVEIAKPFVTDPARPFERESLSRPVLEEGIRLTRAAMAAKVPAIFQPILTSDTYLGMPDFLILNENGSYDPMDAKLASEARTSFLVQMCVCARILESAYGCVPEKIGLFLKAHGNPVVGSPKIYRLEDYRYYFERLERRFHAFHRGFDPSASIPAPEPGCDQGRWSDYAEAILEATDDVALVAGIRAPQVRKLKAARIGTLTELTKTPRSRCPKGMKEATFLNLQAQAKAQLRSRKSEKIHFELRDEGRELAQLPVRFAKGDVVIDMESYTFGPAGTWVYLWGVLCAEQEKGKAQAPEGFEAFSTIPSAPGLLFSSGVATTQADEGKVGGALLKWLYARKRKFPEMHVYHYAHAETTQLSRMTELYGAGAAELESLLNADAFVDLYKIVKSGFWLGSSSYSLKEFEKLVDPKGTRKDDGVGDAMDSMAAFDAWVFESDPGIRKRIMDEIIEYNRHDCVSTWKAIEFLNGVRYAEGITAAREHCEVGALDNELVALGTAPSVEVPPSATSGIQTDLLQFYRRENSSLWGNLFRKLEHSVMDLMDDPEVLGSVGRDKSGKYTYAADQVTKLGEGSTVVRIEDLRAYSKGAEDRLQTYRIKLFHLNERSFSLVHVDSRGRTGAVASFTATRALIGFNTFDGTVRIGLEPLMLKAVAGSLKGLTSKILKRSTPSVLGAESGFALGEAADHSDSANLAAMIARMSGEVLVVQGPPGSGKTTLAGRAIANLLAQAQGELRIGVTSNSHAAINLVLEEAAKALHEGEIDPKRASLLKITSESDPGTAPKEEKETVEGEEDDDEDDDDEDAYRQRIVLTEKKQLSWIPERVAIGVTPLSLASDRMAKRPRFPVFDYLFVDEASQVSLANTIALGECTKNLILLGDQMQLPQPLRAAHPGESGQAGLNYCTAGISVLRPPRGLFLEKTHRLDPKLCSFISDLYYESALQPSPAAGKVTLRIDGRRLEGGLYFESVEHDECSQGSEEEADRVLEVIETLLGGVIRIAGKERQVKLSDILIVAPFNMQVSWLARAAEERGWTEKQGLRIGTVDKFQGTQAPVVLVSMTSSPGVPQSRGIDFLLNPNRLNVAISRAQLATIVVGHEGLADLRTFDPEQARLINGYCKVVLKGAKASFLGHEKVEVDHGGRKLKERRTKIPA